MKPAFHRSAVLWLGFFVLMFLGWLWADSRKTTTSLYKVLELEDTGPMLPLTEATPYVPRDAAYANGATLHDGKLILSYTSATKLKPYAILRRGPLRQMRIAREYDWQVPMLSPLSYLEGANLATVRKYRVEVPMWGIIGGFLVAWGGVMGWRGRAMLLSAPATQEAGDSQRESHSEPSPE